MAWLRYRLLVTSVQGATTTAAIAEIEMRATYGGANLCTGGTAFADSWPNASFSPSKAFDGAASTTWISSPSSLPHHCGYIFPTAVSVLEVSITGFASFPDNNTYPKNVSLQGSDDGNVWSTVQSWTINSFPLGSTQILQVSAQPINASQSGKALIAQGSASILVGDPVFLSPAGSPFIAQGDFDIHVPEPVVITSASGGAKIASGVVNTRITVFANLPRPGYVTTSFGGAEDAAYAIGVQSDGSIVIAGKGGDHQIALARYRPYGSPDTAFGTGGTVLFSPFGNESMARALVIDDEDRIVVAGHAYDGVRYRFCVARFLADGQIDSSFGVGGSVNLTIGNRHAKARGVALQPDGKIVAVGNYDTDIVVNLPQEYPPLVIEGEDFSFVSNAVAVRLLPSGALDNGFGDGGISVISLSNVSFSYLTGVVALPDYTISVSGMLASVIYLQDVLGATGGKSILDAVTVISTTIQNNGAFNEENIYSRTAYDDNVVGTRGYGNIIIDAGVAITARQSGDLLVVGGRLSYEGDDYYFHRAYGIVFSATAENDQFARLLADPAVYSNDEYKSVIGYTECCAGLSPDGGYYAAGFYEPKMVDGGYYEHNPEPARRIRLHRFASSGVIDASYQSGGVVYLEANVGGAPVLRAMLVQPDGGVLLAGWTTVDGEQRAMVMRVTDDGIKDSEFGPYDLYVRVAALYDHNASIAQCRTASEMAVDDELQRVLDAIREAANSGCNALLQIDWTLTVPVMDELVYLLEQLDYTVAKTDARFTDYGSVTISWSAAA